MSARIAIPLLLTSFVLTGACGGTATNVEDDRACGVIVRDYEDLYGRRYGDQTHADFDEILARAETHRSDGAPKCLTLQGISDSIEKSRAPSRVRTADSVRQQLENNKSLGVGAIVLFVLAALLMLASFGASVMLLVIAFQESVVWGLLYLFVPFASLVFVVMYWDKAGRPFLVSLGTGLAAMALMMLAVV